MTVPALKNSALAALLCLCACSPEPPAAPPESQTLALADCRQLQLRGDFSLQLKLRPGAASLRIVYAPGTTPAAAQVNLQDGVELTLANAGHQVEVQCAAFGVLQLQGNIKGSAAAAQVFDFSKVAVYGQSSLHLPRLSAASLDVRAAGGGMLHLDAVVADEMTVLASGRGLVDVSGEAARLQVELGGDARLQAAELRAQWVTIQGRGGARGTLHASAHLGGELRGNSQLRYLGSPDLHLDVVEQASAAPLTQTN